MSKRPGSKRKCDWCPKVFVLRSRYMSQRFCSNKCSNAAHSTDKRRARDLVVLSKYGLDCIAYDNILARQKGRCAICKKLRRGERRLAVDHSHTTGEVRGLLCPPCNIHLGWFETHVARASDYLINVPAYIRKEQQVFLTKRKGFWKAEAGRENHAEAMRLASQRDATLTNQQARQLVSAYEDTSLTFPQLARAFQVSEALARSIYYRFQKNLRYAGEYLR